MKTTFKIGLASSVLAAVALLVLLNRTTQVNSMEVPEFTPFQDDLMAKKYAPQVLSSEQYSNPVALLYRASRHDTGSTHITYHFVWDKEENTGSGWKPFLNRWIYTGGLGLQRTMFGKGDIERVSLVINQSGGVTQVNFETAENYSDSDFGVRHKTVVLEGTFKIPFLFEVVSWNHLFKWVDKERSTTLKAAPVVLTPSYFTQALWQEFEMVKAKEKPLSKSRAHQLYEREFVAIP